MNRQILLDLHKKNLTSSDYNIIQSITKDKILFHPHRDSGITDRNTIHPCLQTLPFDLQAIPFNPQALPFDLQAIDMVVTDTDESIAHWKKQAMAVIAWSHEENPQESLMQAPWLILSLDALSDPFPEEVWHRHHGLPLRLLETERCYLRELAMDDLDPLLALDAEQEADSPGRFFRIPADSHLETNPDPAIGSDPDLVSAARDYLSHYIACQYPFYGYGIYGAYDRSDDRFLGIVGFYQTDSSTTASSDSDSPDAGPELGYAVRREHRRQGYAREWILALTDYARQQWEMTEFVARIPRGHIASIRTALSCHLKIIEI